MFFQITQTNKSSAVSELIDNGGFHSPALLKELVMQRESLGSTFIGHCTAVAHGLIESTDQVNVAFGISKMGIDWGNGKIVHFLLIVASNSQNYGSYVKNISALLSFLHSAEIREDLLNGVSNSKTLEFQSLLEKLKS